MRPGITAAFELFADAVTYRRGVSGAWPLKAAARDFRGDDLFGSAIQSDRLAVVRARDFDSLGIGRPQRYDRVQLNDGEFVVIDWRAAPPMGEAVFYRLAVRGGTK
jgi:hypothetical protein